MTWFGRIIRSCSGRSSGSALAAFVAQHLFNGLRHPLKQHLRAAGHLRPRSDLYSHIQQLPLRWFDNRATGDLMTRVLEDVTSVERMLIDGLEQGVVAVLQVVIVAVVLFRLNPMLALLALSPIPLLAAGALAYTLTAHKRYRLQRTASSAMNALLHDNLAGIRQIKTFVREREEHAHFNAVSDQLREATLVVMKAWALYSPSMDFFAAAGLVLVAGFGRKRGAARAARHRALRAIPHPGAIPLRSHRPAPPAQPALPGRTRRGRARIRDHG